MQFGKVTNPEDIDFSFPKEHDSNYLILPGKINPDFKLYTAAPVWNVKEWVGKIYPLKTKQQDFLKFYSRQFPSIELNSTHYRIPHLTTVEKWYESSAADFKFCPKVPQIISHYGGLENKEFIDDFVFACRGFKEKLGIVFLQLSERFSADKSYLVKNFVSRWPKDIPLAIEYRHESWFNGNHNMKTFMKNNNISTVITDTSGRRDVLNLELTNNSVIVRFVGNNLHVTDYLRIDDWVQQIHKWYLNGINNIYFFIHEPNDILVPELTEYFVNQINKVMPNTLQPLELYNREQNLNLFD